MEGKVLKFNEETSEGVISGNNGERYSFDVADWSQDRRPAAGCKVDFVVTENQKAKEIYAKAGALSGGLSKRITTCLFAFFLGSVGGHKFYLGYKKQGIIMLLVFIFGFILLGIPSIVIGIIALIECILYFTKSDEEFEKIYIVGKKPWF